MCSYPKPSRGERLRGGAGAETSSQNTYSKVIHMKVVYPPVNVLLINYLQGL